MAEYLSPGVYAEEFDTTGNTAELDTGVAGLIGAAMRGQVEGSPQLVRSFPDFRRTFGGYLSEEAYGEYRYLSYAVKQFFENGGMQAYIMRIAPKDAVCASGGVPASTPVLRMTAKNPGRWGDNVCVVLEPSSACEFTMEVRYEDEVERYENLSLKRENPNYVEKALAKSHLIQVTCEIPDAETMIPPFERLTAGEKDTIAVSLSGGCDGTPSSLTAEDFIGRDEGPGKRTGIQSFLDNDLVTSIAVPGVTEPKVQKALISQCESLTTRLAVLDMPKDAKTAEDVLKHRDLFDTTYAAMYHPWLEIFDAAEKRNNMFPPSGSMMGIFARTDYTRGVHKAPANETLRGCVGLSAYFDNNAGNLLNSRGVNPIRFMPGIGIRVWGARTAGSDKNTKYINVRRLLIAIEKNIKSSLGWVMFEKNDEALWERAQRMVEAFLTGMWKDGVLVGAKKEEAFSVCIGRSTMTQDDIDNGRMICDVKFAVTRPNEFLTMRIIVKTSEADESA